MIKQMYVNFPEYHILSSACRWADLSQQGIFKTQSHIFRCSTTKQKCAKLPRNNLDSWQTGQPTGL